MTDISDEVKEHPLLPVFISAIEQCVNGKGQRHGGGKTPFMSQPWVHHAKLHGRGFLTGQAAKKLDEAASTRQGTEFETEMLGAMVYMGMAMLYEKGGGKGNNFEDMVYSLNLDEIHIPRDRMDFIGTSK